MKFGIDEYAHLNSPLHRWDPRFKLVGLVSLIFAFSFVQDLRMLPPMLLVTGLVFALSRLPLLFLLSRLRYPSFFILVVVLFLPFLSGETVIASIGPFDLRQEGLAGALLIGARFLSIVTIGLIIFGTSSLLTALKAMRALGLPSVIADMALLAYRYLYEIGDYLHRMETAMRLRYFRGRRLGPRGELGGALSHQHIEAHGQKDDQRDRRDQDGGLDAVVGQIAPRQVEGSLHVLPTGSPGCGEGGPSVTEWNVPRSITRPKRGRRS